MCKREREREGEKNVPGKTHVVDDSFGKDYDDAARKYLKYARIFLTFIKIT